MVHIVLVVTSVAWVVVGSTKVLITAVLSQLKRWGLRGLGAKPWRPHWAP